MSEINPKLLSEAKKFLIGTSNSVQIVFDVIHKSNQPLRFSEIKNLTTYSDRTIRSALKQLYKLEIVVKVPNIYDLRSHFFLLSPALVMA